MTTEALKILGQAAPGAGAIANVFAAVPAGHAYVVNEIAICNTGAAATKVRVFARLAGAASGVGTAIIYDLDIPGNDTIPYKPGGVYGATDILSAYSLAGGVTFTAFGSDVTL